MNNCRPLRQQFPHHRQIPFTGGRHGVRGIARLAVLFQAEEALEAYGLEGLGNRLEVHHSLADVDEPPHQAVDVAHVDVEQVLAGLVDGHRRILAPGRSSRRRD